MANEFEVSVEGLREHAVAVGDVAEQVSTAGNNAQTTAGGDSFGSIAQFFAQTIMSVSEELRGAIGTGAQSVADVQAGLTATANDYQRTEDHHTRVFQTADGSGTVAAQATTYPSGQRDKAVAVLERISREHPISVATVAVRPVRWFRGWAGNVLSARIGDHYERDIPDLLAQEPTDANIRAVADRETQFWSSDQGNWLGEAVSADRRYNMLIDARTEWLNEMPPAQRADIARRLGVQLGN